MFRGASRSNIINCYVTSSSEFHNVSAFVGIIENTTIKNSFWDLESTGVSFFAVDIVGDQNEIYNTLGLPAKEMKRVTIYEQRGWDFDNVWGINSNFNNGYPF